MNTGDVLKTAGCADDGLPEMSSPPLRTSSRTAALAAGIALIVPVILLLRGGWRRPFTRRVFSQQFGVQQCDHRLGPHQRQQHPVEYHSGQAMDDENRHVARPL
jgi:hypothetical protein